jgi:hypothetical protein
MNRKRTRIGEIELDAEFGVADDDAQFDASDQLADEPWPDADAELAMGDAALGQAADTDPDAIAESGVTTNQLAESLGTQRVGDAVTEVAPTEQQSEAAPSDQSEAASQIDVVQQLLAGDDAELIAAIQQAQAEADAAAEELEQWNQRQNELRETRALAQQRIAELRPKRAELLAELLLRNNRQAKAQLDRISRTLQELEDVDRDYGLVLAMAAQEAAQLLARVAHHSATVRHLQARLKARQLVRQAQAVDQAIVALLGELAQAQQLVEELVPLLPDSARQYLNQFRRGGGDLPIRLSLAYHCRNMGMGSILDLPAYTPQSSRPLSVQIGELLANLLKPTTDNSEVPSAELHGDADSGSAPAA